MKTKKKATIILLLGIIVVAAVVAGLLFAHQAEAETEYNATSVDTGNYQYTVSFKEITYPVYAYTNEGYDNIKDWCLAVKEKKSQYKTIADDVNNKYEGFLLDEQYTLLQECGENIQNCSNLTDMAKYEAQIQEVIAAVQKTKEDYEAAVAASNAQYQAINSYSSEPTYYAPTSSSWSDAASAKAFIIGKESGGSYTATNGRYYGAYQLDSSYLNGDYSAENQDRVAENYVNNRYGGWEGAASFWQSHGWY